MTARKPPIGARAVRAARPVPASINMPDAPLRAHWAYQLYCRLARPTLDWVAVWGSIWSLGLCDLVARPQPNETRLIVLGFAATLFGIRTLEKTKGVA